MIRMQATTLGAVMLTALLLPLVLIPQLSSMSPDAQSLRAALAPPGMDYLLGADQFGRSILARLLVGGRYSLALSFSVVVLCATTGALLASVAAWFGGTWEAAITGIADAVYAVPGLLLVLVIAGLFGGGVTVLVATLWFASWPEYYRLSRGVVRQVVASDHVLCSRILGPRMSVVIWYQILPQVLPYIAGVGTLALGRTMLAIASLGFLGIGIAPPQAEWGAMISDLLPYIQRAPVQVFAPVVAIFWTVTACLLLGQGLVRRVTDGAY